MRDTKPVAGTQSIDRAAHVRRASAWRQYMALQMGKPYAFNAEEVRLWREKLRNASRVRRTWDHFDAKPG